MELYRERESESKGRESLADKKEVRKILGLKCVRGKGGVLGSEGGSTSGR